MPPTPAVRASLALGTGTRYPGIQVLEAADAASADYRLYGRWSAEGVQYAWVQADAELASREIPARKNQTAAMTPVSSLPKVTAWSHGAPQDAGSMLTEYAVRLGRVRAWLTLSGLAGQTVFPYHLVLRKPGSDANVKNSILYEGEKFKLFLQLDPKFKEPAASRRWVYVFAISQQGVGTLMFPPKNSGNEGNHLPRADKDERTTAPATPLIRLLDDEADLEITEQGIDTLVMISTKDPIPNPNIFNFDGVQSSQSRGAGGDPLQDLLESNGDSTRSMSAAKSPGEWSIERATFRSAPKK